ncbi:MAG: cation-translocating P-type ATPase [Actinomycetota bacterium]
MERPGSEVLERTTRLPLSDVFAELGSSPEGLSSGEAEVRLRRIGPNAIPGSRGPSPARQLLEQMIHLFALMLWAAAILAFVGGMPQLGWAIIAVVVINGVFSFAQEYRAERATLALSALLPEMATVIRDGRRSAILAAELVPGDVVLLREGDRISADARVTRSTGLRVDNSTLTGESDALSRDAEPLPDPSEDLIDRTNLVFAGTFVAAGSGQAAVIRTGADTLLGGIARLTGQVVRGRTPLRAELDHAVRVIAAFAVGAGLLFFGVSLWLGTPTRDGFLFAIGVIVALVPEGLLPTLTLSLAISASRMAARGALVRHLEAVETLGSTTVICSDKTGTITANQMTARAVVAPVGKLRVSGTGYDPAGAVLMDGRPLTREELQRAEPLFRAAALCNDSRIESHDGRWVAVGDPTEGALLVLARKAGVEREDAEHVAPRIAEFPFDSSRRRMTTVHRLASGASEVLTKGSPEDVLAVCSSLLDRGGTRPVSDEERARVAADVDALAADGLRVLAFARRTEEGDLAQASDDVETGLSLIGLVGLADPVRPEVPDAVRRCRQAGIRVVMVTGDHPSTAAAVAADAGLAAGPVVLGADLPEDDAALQTLLADPAVSVLARVAPEQKLRIARALQASGEVVAMTGDGVNDGPALRQADIGVAMGVVGTDVARGAADIVLLDDNFAHIVEAVEEGRAAFDNIRRFLTYHLTDNVAELTPFVLWALSAGAIPLVLSVLQILALDIGTDLLPALALGAERPEPGTMRRPPRSRRARLLDRRVLGRAFGFLGPIEAAVSLSLLPIGAALFFGWHTGSPMPHAGLPLATLSTLVFASIVAMQMANAFACRSTPGSLFSIGPLSNRLLVAAVGVEAVILLCFVHIPPVARLLGMRALTPSQWIPVLVAPFLLLAAEEARKAVVRQLR